MSKSSSARKNARLRAERAEQARAEGFASAAEKSRSKLMPPPKPGEIRNPMGRAPGLSNADYAAVRASRLRLPDGVDPESAVIAQRGLTRIVEIMEGKVPYRKANTALKAAVAIREEVCGPIAKKVELGGGLSLEKLVAAAGAPLAPPADPPKSDE